jgi:chitinase
MKQPVRSRRALPAAVLALAGLTALPWLGIRTACAGEPITVGYFPAWGVYDRNYLMQQVDRSGAAGRLDVRAYAFAAIGADDLVALADPVAAIEQPYAAAASVDGIADQPGAGVLRGAFNQLRKLTLLHPALKAVISIGGWSGSARFSDMALDPDKRRLFAASCIERLIAGNFAAGIRQAGIFDGIDIDWEYPATAGASAHARAEDAHTFTALLAELRRQLDQRSAADGRAYLLTAALPATPAVSRRLELGSIQRSLDLLLLMTYDYHGAWDAAPDRSRRCIPPQPIPQATSSHAPTAPSPTTSPPASPPPSSSSGCPSTDMAGRASRPGRMATASSRPRAARPKAAARAGSTITAPSPSWARQPSSTTPPA